MRKRISTRKIAIAGLLTAMIALLTAYIMVPLPTGYTHLGDGPVILCGLMLGPFGAIPAALGSALADLLAYGGSYAVYAPFSAVIKGVMALITAKWIALHEQASLRNMLIVVGAFIWMVAAYFVADTLLKYLAYRDLAAAIRVAAASNLGNLVQAAVGAIMSAAFLKLEPQIRRLSERQ